MRPARDIGQMIERSARKFGLRGPTPRGEYAACCPFCFGVVGKHDVKFKLALQPKNDLFYCYRCETGGHVDLTWLKDKRERDPAPAGDPAQPPPNLGPPEGFAALDFGNPYHAPYITYLDKRRVLEEAMLVGAGTCGNTGRFRGRVIIPMRDQTGRWTGFSARSIWPKLEPKYLYPSGMDRRHSLWGLEFLRIYHVEDVFLVEGVFDALPLFPHALAAFGKNVTDEQLAILGTLGRPITVCLDGDAWEEGRALALRLRLRGLGDVRWCRLPPKSDPGVLGWTVRNFVEPC